MKKVTYIVFGLAILTLASCQKQCFEPSDSAELDASKVEWKSTDAPLDKTVTKRSSLNDKALDQSASNSNSGFDTGGSTDTESGITDPNNDPDAGKKKGKK